MRCECKTLCKRVTNTQLSDVKKIPFLTLFFHTVFAYFISVSHESYTVRQSKANLFQHKQINRVHTLICALGGVHMNPDSIRIELILYPWIWRENQQGVLIGFSYSEIRFLNKNIVKCLELNAIFRQSIHIFQFFFVLQHYR